MIYDIPEEELIKLFEEEHIDIWVNSFGGCRSNYIRDCLKDKFDTYNRAYEYKACHYIRPLDVNVECGIFCYVEDVGIALTSQLHRGLTHNFEKLRDDKDLRFSMENWLININKQIDNWVTNSHFKTYIINTDKIQDHKFYFEDEFGVKMLSFEKRETREWDKRLKPYKREIDFINDKLKDLADFTYIDYG